MENAERLLDAVHLATGKLVSTQDAKQVLREVLEICIETVDALGGTIYIHDQASQTLRFLHVIPEDIERKLGRLDLPDDYGVAGEVFHSGKTVISKYGDRGNPHRQDIRRQTGVTVNTMITVPLQVHGQKPIGIVQVVNKKHGDFDETDEAVLATISDVATLAILNSRMLQSSKRVASLEGMGRAAHDLANKAGVLVTFLPDFERNIRGLKKSLAEQGVTGGDSAFYIEMLEAAFHDVFSPYSERVYRYARLINDLAAGKPLVPKLKVNDFASVVQEAAQYMETQARRNYVKIEYDLQRDAPEFAFDDLFVIRIVENILGNAIKAVRETVTAEWLAQHSDEDDAVFGRITVQYRFTNSEHVLRIIDSGSGMSPAQVRSILGGKARSQWQESEGSGLGTKVVTDLIAAHGAKLSINSRLGEGSTFEIEFPDDQRNLLKVTSSTGRATS